MILGLAEYGAGTGVSSTPLLMRASRATLVLAAEGFPAMPPVLVHRMRFAQPPIRRQAHRAPLRRSARSLLRNVAVLAN
jgi:hypothetical protein